MADRIGFDWTDYQNVSRGGPRHPLITFEVSYNHLRWVASIVDGGGVSVIGPLDGYATREGAKRACEIRAIQLGAK